MHCHNQQTNAKLFHIGSLPCRTLETPWVTTCGCAPGPSRSFSVVLLAVIRLAIIKAARWPQGLVHSGEVSKVGPTPGQRCEGTQLLSWPCVPLGRAATTTGNRQQAKSAALQCSAACIHTHATTDKCSRNSSSVISDSRLQTSATSDFRLTRLNQ